MTSNLQIRMIIVTYVTITCLYISQVFRVVVVVTTYSIHYVKNSFDNKDPDISEKHRWRPLAQLKKKTQLNYTRHQEKPHTSFQEFFIRTKKNNVLKLF